MKSGSAYAMLHCHCKGKCCKSVNAKESEIERKIKKKIIIKSKAYK